MNFTSLLANLKIIFLYHWLRLHSRDEIIKIATKQPSRYSFFSFKKNILHSFLHQMPHKRLFTLFYEKNIWGNAESASGTGSTLHETVIIRSKLIDVIKQFNIKTMLDIPCGDFNWMKLVVNEIDIHYTGGDIVGKIIKRNKEQYATSQCNFEQFDVVNDLLPYSDLIFCRDCLVHFSNEMIKKALANIKNSKSKYFITTTFPDHNNNEDIVTGYWRPLNLEKPPFSLPSPLLIIKEMHPEPLYEDKSLGLWRVSDL